MSAHRLRCEPVRELCVRGSVATLKSRVASSSLQRFSNCNVFGCEGSVTLGSSYNLVPSVMARTIELSTKSARVRPSKRAERFANQCVLASIFIFSWVRWCRGCVRWCRAGFVESNFGENDMRAELAPTHPPTLCSIPSALARTGIGRSFLYERLAEGSIRSVKAGRRRLIDVASLDQWCASLPLSQLKQTGRDQ